VPPTRDGPGGDPDGQAVEVLRIGGNQIAFGIIRTGIDTPTAGHIHPGATGVIGLVRVPFFGVGLPGNLHAVTGSATVTDGLCWMPFGRTGAASTSTRTHRALPRRCGPRAAGRGRTPIDLDAVLRDGPLAALLSGTRRCRPRVIRTGTPPLRPPPHFCGQRVTPAVTAATRAGRDARPGSRPAATAPNTSTAAATINAGRRPAR